MAKQVKGWFISEKKTVKDFPVQIFDLENLWDRVNGYVKKNLPEL